MQYPAIPAHVRGGNLDVGDTRTWNSLFNATKDPLFVAEKWRARSGSRTT